jgi:hypothetical protein
MISVSDGFPIVEGHASEATGLRAGILRAQPEQPKLTIIQKTEAADKQP